MKGELEILTLFVQLKITNNTEDITGRIKTLVFIKDND